MYSCAPASEPEIARYTGFSRIAAACLGFAVCSWTSRSNVDAASSINAHSSPLGRFDLVEPSASPGIPVTRCGASAAAPASRPSASARRRAGSTVTTTTRASGERRGNAERCCGGGLADAAGAAGDDQLGVGDLVARTSRRWVGVVHAGHDVPSIIGSTSASASSPSWCSVSRGVAKRGNVTSGTPMPFARAVRSG